MTQHPYICWSFLTILVEVRNHLFSIWLECLPFLLCNCGICSLFFTVTSTILVQVICFRATHPLPFGTVMIVQLVHLYNSFPKPLHLNTTELSIMIVLFHNIISTRCPLFDNVVWVDSILYNNYRCTHQFLSFSIKLINHFGIRQQLCQHISSLIVCKTHLYCIFHNVFAHISYSLCC